MLTRAGALALLLSVVSGSVAVLFGVPELFLVALVSAGLALAAVGTVAVRPPLRVVCTPKSARVPCGTPLVVRLRASNEARRRTVRTADIVDSAAELPGPVLALGPMPPGAVVDASYNLPSERRGWRDVGPLWLEARDPFGLARLRHRAAPHRRILVWPRIEDLGSLSGEIDDDAARRRRARFIWGTETDFHSLREYEPGDNPHRIHWPSSARRRELLVRRFEAFQHLETLIYLETDAAAASPATFERMVSAAAGLATAAAGVGMLRLLTRFGPVAGTTKSPVPVLDALALVTQSPPAEAPVPLGPAATERATVLAVIGDVRPDRPLVLPRTSGRRIVLQFWDAGAPLRHPDVVTIGPDDSPAGQWHAHRAARRQEAEAAGEKRPAGVTR